MASISTAILNDLWDGLWEGTACVDTSPPHPFIYEWRKLLYVEGAAASKGQNTSQ